jgi:hypothetical protein
METFAQAVPHRGSDTLSILYRSGPAAPVSESVDLMTITPQGPVVQRYATPGAPLQLRFEDMQAIEVREKAFIDGIGGGVLGAVTGLVIGVLRGHTELYVF